MSALRPAADGLSGGQSQAQEAAATLLFEEAVQPPQAPESKELRGTNSKESQCEPVRSQFDTVVVFLMVLRISIACMSDGDLEYDYSASSLTFRVVCSLQMEGWSLRQFATIAVFPSVLISYPSLMDPTWSGAFLASSPHTHPLRAVR
jgi:hypothetical protein